MNGRSRKAYVNFHDAFRSWSSITQRQAICDLRMIQNRSFFTSKSKKASVQFHNDSISRFGMSSLISPLMRSPLQRQQQYGPDLLKDDVELVQSFPQTREQQYTKVEQKNALKSILKSAENGQVLQTMSQLIDAVTHHLEGRQSKSALKIDRHLFTKMMYAMAKVGRSYGTEWDKIKQEVKAEHIWRPINVSSKVELESMPVQTLAMYAIASLYDLASTSNLLPSTASQASALRTLSLHLDIDTFTQCLSLILLQLSGKPFHEAQLMAMNRTLDYKEVNSDSIPADIVKAVLDGFSECGKPELGESFLLWWANSLERKSSDRQLSAVFAKMPSDHQLADIPLSNLAWKEDEYVWTALIRSRSKVGDISGAKHWLQQYRRLYNHSTKTAAPYLEYLRCCATSSKKDSVRQSENSFSRLHESEQMTRKNLYRDALEMIKEDQIPIDEKSFSFLVNFEVGHAYLEVAAQLIFDAYDTMIVKGITPNIYKGLFLLHKRCAVRTFGKSKPFDHIERSLSPMGSKCIGPINDLRSLVCFFVSKMQSQKRWNKVSQIEALNQALEASVALGDLPLALIVQESVKTLGAEFGIKSENAALSWLQFCRYGFGGVHQYPKNTPAVQQFGRSWSRNEKAIRAAHKRLTPGQSQITTGSPSTEEKLQGERQEPDLKLVVENYLLQSVRQGLTAKEEHLSAPWVQELCTEVKRSSKDWTDEEIVRSAARQILFDEKGKVRVKSLNHLL